MTRLLFVVNSLEFFLSHRLPIAIKAKSLGYEVHIAGMGAATSAQRIIDLGFTYHKVDFVRSGQNPLHELRTFFQLFRLFRALRPDLVHLITIKPVLYGGIAARLAGVPAVVSAVSGLGTVFLDEAGGHVGLRRRLVSSLYRLAFSHRRMAIIFQNPDDKEMLIRAGALQPEQSRMIRGSGVNLAEYPRVAEPTGQPVVVMAARLLRDKGVFEFVEAARILQGRQVDVLMRLIGAPDPENTSSVTERDLENWRNESQLELLGYRTDIADQYAASNIVCLPSYREGLPKGLVEAAACGRAVVTTDVPGCRDAIEPGITGLLVPVKDASALADAIQELAEAPERRSRMGGAGRRLAEEFFTIEKVVEQHMDIYRELLTDE